MNTDLDPEGPPPESLPDLTKLGLPPQKILEPGIYFDLDEDFYHASFGLSYSGIKHFRISPYDWWVRSPLNPDQAKVLEEENNSVAREMGKAFDARIICGRDYFYARYAASITHELHKTSLRTIDDMKGWLEDHGLSKSAKTKAELIDRILCHDGRVKIWDVIKEQYEDAHEGKEFLSEDLIEKIEVAAAMIEKHPELSKALSGGEPQVSVVWNCEATGTPCKARFDYLKPKVIVDLKTLLPREDIPLETSIGKEIGNRKYYIQSAFYLEAADKIPNFIRAGKIFGTPRDPRILDMLVKNRAKEWLWIFQLKGAAPVAKGRLLHKDSHVLQLGRAECDNAKHQFRECLNIYGALPWVAPEPIKTMDDADIPAWSLL